MLIMYSSDEEFSPPDDVKVKIQVKVRKKRDKIEAPAKFDDSHEGAVVDIWPDNPTAVNYIDKNPVGKVCLSVSVIVCSCSCLFVSVSVFVCPCLFLPVFVCLSVSVVC